MTSTRPYLIRAFYEWILDNLLTPYLLVNAEKEGVEVPTQIVKDGKVIFNISPKAIKNLKITNQIIEFEASFAGNVEFIYLPIKAVEAVYAQENGRGMVFNQMEEEDDDAGAPPPPPRKAGKPKLSVVK